MELFGSRSESLSHPTSGNPIRSGPVARRRGARIVGAMSDFRDPLPDEERPVIPDDERIVDLDDETELELPPPTLDPDESVEDEPDPLVEDERDEARGLGGIEE